MTNSISPRVTRREALFEARRILRRRGKMPVELGVIGALLLSASSQGQAQSIPAPSGAAVSVTLVTGDRVSVSANAEVDIQRGIGREHIGFLTERRVAGPGRPEHLFVIPEDAIALLAAERIDPRLFDVTLLVEYGYDDARREDLPLIVSYPAGVAQALAGRPSAMPGAAVRQNLPAIGGMAIRSSKARTHELWASLAASRTTAGTGSALASQPSPRLWLDGKLEPLLDRSVVQIGAPAAWALGYEGDGVVVAVLDSWVDVTHPDLADAVVVTRNFTDGPPVDEASHGTHVASIIAGSGAASSGLYRGVAPGAQLLAAQVCNYFDCIESSVIAALHWAVAEEGAQVVNMSFGDVDAPGFDPIEEAVSTLAAQYDTLFVAAAGNSGPHPRTIGRPANLAAALTVGAVDAGDRVTDFSSRGLTIGDTIKPDLTAPSGVTAARAAGTEGRADDVYYSPLGGTSSAAPHVTGAAALLFQQHPDWTAADVKARLMGSAAFNPAYGVIDQGAGRVDVAAALGESFFASTASVSFGLLRWPHGDDGVLTRTIGYRNPGPARELVFELDVVGPDGARAPDGMFSVTPSSATLPEGGALSVRLQADPRLGGLVGVYGGRLIASDAAGGGLAIPIAVELEAESYDLVIRHLDRQGSAARAWRSILIGPDGSARVFQPNDSPEPGDVTLRLPKGAGYAIEASIPELDESLPLTRILAPNLSVDADALLVLDARVASPVRVAAPSPGAEHVDLHALLVLPTPTGDYISRFDVDHVADVAFYQAELDPPAPGLEAWLTSQWLDSSTTPPALFAATWTGRGELPVGPVGFEPSQAAVVRSSYAAPSAFAPEASVIRVAPFLGGRIQYASPSTRVTLPYQRTEYLYADDPELRWITQLTMVGAAVGAGAGLEHISEPYLAGREYVADWNQPVFSPALPELSEFSDWAYREGDQLVILPRMHSDGAGHGGYVLTDTGATRLYRQGELLAETATGEGGTFSVPAEAATYRLEIDSRQSLLELTPEQTVAWTFESGHVAEPASARIPLLVVRFTPALSAGGRAPLGPFALPVSVDRYAQEGPPEVGAPSVEVSYDDGVSWSAVSVEPDAARWIARLDHPSGAGYVSLRASARDAQGNQVEQTLLRAYALSASDAP